MKAIEIIAIIASVLIVAGVIIKSIIDKKKGKTGCSFGCSGCPNASACSKGCKNRDKTIESNETKNKE